MVMSHLHIRVKLSDVIWLKYKLIWFEVFVGYKEEAERKGELKKDELHFLERKAGHGWYCSLAGSECWEGVRTSLLLWQTGHEGSMWRGNVARDVVFSMQKKPCVVQEAVWSLSLSLFSNWNLTGCQMSALKFPDLGGDRGVPTATWMCLTGSCWCPNWEENSTKWLRVGWECELCPGSRPWNSKALLL